MRKIPIVSLIVATISILSFSLVAQAQSRQELLAQIETKRAEMQKLEQHFLSPSDEDRAAFTEFLKQPDTGLIRLLPREIFDQFPDKSGKLTIRGGGAYYSFVRLTHEYGYGSDLQLSNGDFSVGFAGADYGIMTIAGEGPLDEVTLESPAAAFLNSYSPTRNDTTAFSKGRTVGEFTYKNQLPVQLNATYLLRSISDQRTDVLVAFQVVRKDSDGSVIIAWKLLKKFPTPNLSRSTASS